VATLTMATAFSAITAVRVKVECVGARGIAVETPSVDTLADGGEPEQRP
jgi:hypothetical protein